MKNASIHKLVTEWPPQPIKVKGGRGWMWSEPMYRVNVVVMQCPHEHLQAALESIGVKAPAAGETPPAGKVIEHWKDKGCGTYIVWIAPEWKANPDGLNTLVHETMHVTMTALMRRGIQADVDHEEPYCYFAGHIFERCYCCLKGLI